MSNTEMNERLRAQKRLEKYQEMADQQVKMIMESMLTLKKVDESNASMYLVDPECTTNTDAILEKIFKETIISHSLP